MDDNRRIRNRFADERLTSVWWALRVGLGVAVFLAGLDKFFNLLADWPQYLHPAVARLIAADTFMQIVGAVEMIVGVVILAGWTRLGGYVAGAWLIGIALNLIAQARYFDIAVRDVLIAVAAFSLAKLSEVRRSGIAVETPEEWPAEPSLRRTAV